MRYEIIIKPTAEKCLDRIPRLVRRRILDAIDGLRGNPRPPGVVKLASHDTLWRVRIGDYRVVYEVRDDRLLILIVRVAHRKDV